jgi:hypothetical protein
MRLQMNSWSVTLELEGVFSLSHRHKTVHPKGAQTMPQKTIVRKEDVATWPRPVRQAIDAIAATMSALFLLARARAADHLSPIIRALAERDAIFHDRELLRREADILRSRDAPTTANMLVLVRGAIRRFGKPRFLVTDGGSQFRSRFRNALKPVDVVKGRRDRRCQFNGKAERFFKSFRIWQRVTLFAWRIPSIQRKLDIYREWYNAARPIFGLGCRMPDEIWAGVDSPIRAAMPIRENDPVKPALNVHRLHYRGDPNLIQLAILIVRSVKRSA